MSRLPEWQGGASILGGRVAAFAAVEDDPGENTSGALRVSVSNAAGQIETGERVNVSAGSSLWRESIALSYMAEDPRDIRPDLLLFVAARDVSRYPKLLEYGCNYLGYCLAMHGREIAEAVLESATTDALGVMLLRRAPATVRVRAAHHRMRAAEYGLLRRKAVEVFRRRYREATERYIQALAGVENTRNPAE